MMDKYVRQMDDYGKLQIPRDILDEFNTKPSELPIFEVSINEDTEKHIDLRIIDK